MAKDTNTTELAQEVQSSFIRVAIYCFLDQHCYEETTLVHFDDVYYFICHHPRGRSEIAEMTLDQEIMSFFEEANWYYFEDSIMNCYFAPPRDIHFQGLWVKQSDWALDIDRYRDLIKSPHTRLEWFNDRQGDPMGMELRDAIIKFRMAKQPAEKSTGSEKDAA